MRQGPIDPAAARNDIEQTRQRMSGTLDQIEEVILRKKEELEEKKAEIRRKLDLGARVREQPLMAAGVVLGAGFLIGFLSGGGGRKEVRSARRRGTKWETRARRLLEIARNQERELEELRTGLGYADDDRLEDDDFAPDEGDADYAYLRGDEIYPLDPEFDDDTIEYPIRTDHGRSWRDRLSEFAANAIESALDSVPSRR